MSDPTPLQKRLAEIDQEAYDRLDAWSRRPGFSFNAQARRDARLVCSTVLRLKLDLKDLQRYAEDLQARLVRLEPSGDQPRDVVS